MFTVQSSAANRPGAGRPSCIVVEPSTGPMVTPRLVAADSQPNARARSCGFVASATYAWITPTVPPPAPWITRDRSNSHTESANANTTYAIADAPSPIRSAGRRPYLSEKRPHNGALTSCATENAAIRTVTTNPLAPRSVAKNGSSGITISTPTMSTNAVTMRMASFRALSRRVGSACGATDSGSFVSPASFSSGDPLPGAPALSLTRQPFQAQQAQPIGQPSRRAQLSSARTGSCPRTAVEPRRPGLAGCLARRPQRTGYTQQQRALASTCRRSPLPAQ